MSDKLIAIQPLGFEAKEHVKPRKTMADQKPDVHENRFVVFVPYCDAFRPYIHDCVRSIRDQHYDNVKLVIVNDGGALPEDLGVEYVVISGEDNLGPAWSKWTFVNHVATNPEMYQPNDVVLILDGDDTLAPGALRCINNTYNTKKCWCTFGEATGKFCKKHSHALKEASRDKLSLQDMRTGEFYANHPRTFKAGLCKLFKKHHFMYQGEWLKKCTDLAIMYPVFESCGNEKISYIDRVNYIYREHDLNSYKTVSAEYKNKVLTSIQKQPKHAQVIDDIHIVMCSWKRYDNIPSQLKCLSEQSINNNIHLHVVNNNQDPEAIQAVNQHVELARISGVVNDRLHVHVSHYDNTHYGFARFLHIRDHLLTKYILDYVVIIDDDQLFPVDWLNNLWNSRHPGGYTGWLCRRWSGDNVDYWKGSDIKWYECRMLEQPVDLRPVHYVATCGCLIDVRIFHEKSMLWDTPHGLAHDTTVLNIEDLWLSYVAYRSEYTLKRSFLPMDVDLNLSNPDDEHSQWKQLHKQKQTLLEYLHGISPEWLNSHR